MIMAYGYWTNLNIVSPRKQFRYNKSNCRGIEKCLIIKYTVLQMCHVHYVIVIVDDIFVQKSYRIAKSFCIGRQSLLISIGKTLLMYFVDDEKSLMAFRAEMSTRKVFFLIICSYRKVFVDELSLKSHH